MASKKRKKGNRFKSENKATAKPRTGGLKNLLGKIRDRRVRRLFGLILILFSLYCTVAFTSFIFTWKIDQSMLSGDWWVLLTDGETQAENWLGKLGAMLSHVFIHQWFGIASYIFVFLFLVIGLRLLFRVRLLPMSRTLGISLFALIWISMSLGYFFDEPVERFLGGSIGYQVDLWLKAAVGNAGLALLLFFSLGGALILIFNPSFEAIGEKLKAIIQNWREKRAEVAREKEEYRDTIGEEDDFTSITKDTEAESGENEPETEPDPEPEIKEEEPVKDQEMEVSGDFEESPAEEAEEDDEDDDDDENHSLPPEAALTDEELGRDDEEFSVEVAEGEGEMSEEELEKRMAEFGEYDPKLDLASYQMPAIDLLEKHDAGNSKVTKDELEQNKERIVTTLENYKIGIEKIKATIGPTVTLYEIVPEAGVRIKRIKSLEDDIALSLAARGIRIIAPIPGRGTIGIEVPNSKPDIVSMRSLIASEKFQDTSHELPIALGKTISNETYVTDLAKMPHLLMAGATGQGKSVGLNAILVSLLYKKHPSQVKFVMVDPKMVELTLFNKIERHFLAKLPGEEEAIITDTSKVIATLNSLVAEMEQRTTLLKDAMVRNIKEYNNKFIKRRLNPENGHQFMPYIVLVIDEFADLIMTAGKEIEQPIARLAQKARAVGIHLIIATQRPSVNIFTGSIKANFPARIAFRVSSKVDSRTILDAGGADQLIGRGDMLFNPGSDMVRLQCGFVDTPEVAEVCEFIGSQRGYPEAFKLPEAESEGDSGGSLADEERDDMFEDAARVIVTHQQGSTSLLQRKLKLGYNRAGRIVDQLEAAGIVGPFEGSKARQVLISDLASLEQLLNTDSQQIEN